MRTHQAWCRLKYFEYCNPLGSQYTSFWEKKKPCCPRFKTQTVSYCKVVRASESQEFQIMTFDLRKIARKSRDYLLRSLSQSVWEARCCVLQSQLNNIVKCQAIWVKISLMELQIRLMYLNFTFWQPFHFAFLSVIILRDNKSAADYFVWLHKPLKLIMYVMKRGCSNLVKIN